MVESDICCSYCDRAIGHKFGCRIGNITTDGASWSNIIINRITETMERSSNDMDMGGLSK